MSVIQPANPCAIGTTLTLEGSPEGQASPEQAKSAKTTKTANPARIAPESPLFIFLLLRDAVLKELHRPCEPEFESG